MKRSLECWFRKILSIISLGRWCRGSSTTWRRTVCILKVVNGDRPTFRASSGLRIIYSNTYTEWVPDGQFGPEFRIQTVSVAGQIYWFNEYIFSFLDTGPLNEAFDWWGIWGICLKLHFLVRTGAEPRAVLPNELLVPNSHQFLKRKLINWAWRYRTRYRSNQNHKWSNHLN